MSATNRGAKRLTNDGYNTPEWCVVGLRQRMHIPYRASFLEPCRGLGNVYHCFDTQFKYWCEIEEGLNYFDWQPPQPIDISVTNPPFSIALPFLEKMLGEAKTVVALLRLNFLASVERRSFWLANKPTHTIVLSKRPVFAWFCKGEKGRKGCGFACHPGATEECPECGGRVAAGTDATDYGWFAWDRGGHMLTAPGWDWI